LVIFISKYINGETVEREPTYKSRHPFALIKIVKLLTSLDPSNILHTILRQHVIYNENNAMQVTFKPQISPQVSHQAYRVGKEKTPLVVIDNFLQDPEALIDFCVESAAFNNADSFYPGLRMPAPELYLQSIHYFFGDLFAEVFGLGKDQWLGGKSLYSMVITPPDQLSPQQCLPHVDSFRSGDLACVHFLCGEDKGGTSLYRHKSTGFERLDDVRIEQYDQKVIAEGALEHAKAYMNGSTDSFERIASISPKFNRLLVYPGNLLHSGNIAPDFDFDPNPRSGRLTLNSFIFCKHEDTKST
jgi:hypothetical protein